MMTSPCFTARLNMASITSACCVSSSSAGAGLSQDLRTQGLCTSGQCMQRAHSYAGQAWISMQVGPASPAKRKLCCMAACMRPFAAASFSTMRSCTGCPRARLATSALTCTPPEVLDIRNIGQAGGRYNLTPTECLLLALYPAGMLSTSPPVWTGSSGTASCSSALPATKPRGACASFKCLCELQLAPMGMVQDQVHMPMHLESGSQMLHFCSVTGQSRERSAMGTA